MRPFVTVRIICGILLGKRTNLACTQVLENLCSFQIFQLEQTFSSLSHPVRAVLKPRAPDTSNYKSSIPVGEQMCQHAFLREPVQPCSPLCDHKHSSGGQLLPLWLYVQPPNSPSPPSLHTILPVHQYTTPNVRVLPAFPKCIAFFLVAKQL